MKKRFLHLDVFVGIMFLLLGIFGFIGTINMPEKAAAFPKIILSLMILLSIILLLFGIKKTIKMERAGGEVPALNFTELGAPLAVAALTFFYVLCVWKVGFYVSTAIFIFVMMVFFNERSIKRIMLTILICLVFLYIIFTWQLGVIMPKGFLF